MPRRLRLRATCWLPALTGLVLFAPCATQAADPDAADLAFFESKIRPILVDRCVSCHGTDKQKGSLRLDSRADLLAGGDSGPAVEPGDAEASLLVEAVRRDGLAMPPDGPLPQAEVDLLVQWVEQGAPWPGVSAATGTTVRAARGVTDADRAFWSFQPLARPALPAVSATVGIRAPIDRFIRARLEQAGIEPAPEADPATLIRRLAFDLTGLPPSPEEVDAYVRDDRPDAYERLVERLLASPRYGERWARHWLDLVRYAESDGHRQDAYRPEAWRYRDYVIAAFNADLPFDRFTLEQLAGDELDPADPRLRIATSYYRHGTYEFNQRDVAGQWRDILNDVTDVTGEVFLGLSIGCARCHNHKFDPILQDDYFRLQAVFTPLRHRDDLPLASDSQMADHHVARAAWDLATADLRAEIAAIEAPHRDRARIDAISKLQPDMQAILAKPTSERSPYEQQLAELAWRQVTEEWNKIETRLKGDERKRWDELQKRLAALAPLAPLPLPRSFSVTDIGVAAPPTRIPGDRAGRSLDPGVPTVLSASADTTLPPEPVVGSTGRRLALARWLTSPDHPLTPRVLANRVWQTHFGRGLVATPSDFGKLGDTPSHPELLDWLATELVSSGWSVKHLHRQIVLSATYRQAAVAPASETARGVDPENRLLWRANRQRLDAEQLHDAMLCASGELQSAASGGPAADPKLPRRAVFLRVVRNSRDPLLDAFDAPDGFASTAVRNRTTTATQSLLLWNGRWSLDRARALAHRVERQAADASPGSRVATVFRLVLGRPPDATEESRARAFLRDQAAAGASEIDALTDLGHVLLNSNAFLYVD